MGTALRQILSQFGLVVPDPGPIWPISVPNRFPTPEHLYSTTGVWKIGIGAIEVIGVYMSNSTKRKTTAPAKRRHPHSKISNPSKKKKEPTTNEDTAPRIKFDEDADGETQVKNEGDDLSTWVVKMQTAFGTSDFEFVRNQVLLLINATTKGSQLSEDECNSALATMHAIRPRDEIEAMLVSQMLAVNIAAMTMSRRLLTSDTIEQQTSASNSFTKLTRTFTTQMEALNRYRGKGQQKMTVEHVHVHEGGQAMVGEFNQGGGNNKKEPSTP